MAKKKQPQEPYTVVSWDVVRRPTRLRCFCGTEIDAADVDVADARERELFSRLNAHYRTTHEKKSREDANHAAFTIVREGTND